MVLPAPASPPMMTKSTAVIDDLIEDVAELSTLLSPAHDVVVRTELADLAARTISTIVPPGSDA